MTWLDQTRRLTELDLLDRLELTEDELRRQAQRLIGDDADAVLAVHPAWAPPSVLAPLLRRDGKEGFVVEDMTDVDEFVPIADVEIPAGPLYAVRHIDRGDAMGNWSPHEALPAITSAGRSPLTLNEGICWLLQQPDRLEPNRCFMTIGSRKPTTRGPDARTPAVWISGGTGRDGVARRGAPKVGWCWAGNRHTWLGFASARDRRG